MSLLTRASWRSASSSPQSPPSGISWVHGDWPSTPSSPSRQCPCPCVRWTEREPTFHVLISGHIGDPEPHPDAVASTSQSTMVTGWCPGSAESSSPEQPVALMAPSLVSTRPVGSLTSTPLSAGPRGRLPPEQGSRLPKEG